MSKCNSFKSVHPTVSNVKIYVRTSFHEKRKLKALNISNVLNCQNCLNLVVWPSSRSNKRRFSQKKLMSKLVSYRLLSIYGDKNMSGPFCCLSDFYNFSDEQVHLFCSSCHFLLLSNQNVNRTRDGGLDIIICLRTETKKSHHSDSV